MLIHEEQAKLYREVMDVLGMDEDGDAVGVITDMRKKIERLRTEGAKSERRAVTFGDIVHTQVIVMRAAVVDAYLRNSWEGIHWIKNTLRGPGHYPDIVGARDTGGAQALFDRETAQHEVFRAEHPAP